MHFARRNPPNDRDQSPYKCPGTIVFDCGRYPGTYYHKCTKGTFECTGNTLYDFRCVYDFQCTNTKFSCQGQHIFSCGQLGEGGVGNFHCTQGATFECGAGGSRCGIPGVQGYAIDPPDNVPGDFCCVGGPGAQRFGCRDNFTCQGADDFKCQGGNLGDFECLRTFHCTPGTSAGQLRCRNNGQRPEYSCTPPFQCQGAYANG